MAQKNNWQQYKDIIERNNIKCLYHFTDRENLESIINNGGLYSWADCKAKGIDIPKPVPEIPLSVVVFSRENSSKI